PWTVVKTDPEAAAQSLRIAINLIRIFAVLSAPVIPDTAGKMAAALGLTLSPTDWIERDLETELQVLKPGHPFIIPEVLFRKISDEEVAIWESRFGGRD